MKYLNNAQKKNIILKVKNSLLDLEQNFKPMNVSIDDMDKFEQKETKKRTFAKKSSIS